MAHSYTTIFSLNRKCCVAKWPKERRKKRNKNRYFFNLSALDVNKENDGGGGRSIRKWRSSHFFYIYTYAPLDSYSIFEYVLWSLTLGSHFSSFIFVYIFLLSRFLSESPFSRIFALSICIRFIIYWLFHKLKNAYDRRKVTPLPSSHHTCYGSGLNNA